MPYPGKERKPSPLSRRSFLKLVGAGLTITAVAAIEPQHALAKINGRLPPLDAWKPATFISRIGQVFILNDGPENHVSLSLIQVNHGNAKIHRGPNHIVDAPADDCFTLVFRGPRAPVLQQNTYMFNETLFGSFSLFITPASASQQGQNYTAIINHVHA